MSDAQERNFRIDPIEDPRERGEAMTARHMMKCGHVADGITLRAVGPPVKACVDCSILGNGDAIEVAYDITGRTAKCRLCDYVTESDFHLMNFAWHRDEACDWFECGCRGTE